MLSIPSLTTYNIGYSFVDVFTITCSMVQFLFSVTKNNLFKY